MLTEYERERAQRITRNNKMLQSLGIPALAYILNSSNAKGKGFEHGVVDKVSETSNTTRSFIIPTRGTRGPTRVLAEPIHQGLDARMTRKRTREQSGEEDELLTEYERERAQRTMRNNQMLQSLGIPALASILNRSNAKSKRIEHGMVDKENQNLLLRSRYEGMQQLGPSVFGLSKDE
ncbi:unnamed protein product [Urochloa humidicola]